MPQDRNGPFPRSLWPFTRDEKLETPVVGEQAAGTYQGCGQRGDGTLLADWEAGGVMAEVPQNVDGEELDLPLNQEPGTAAPQIEINYDVQRGQEDRELGKDEGERQELDRSEAGM